MARPKTIQLEAGTVLLQGFPKEVSEKLTSYIKAFELPVAVEPSIVPEVKLPVLEVINSMIAPQTPTNNVKLENLPQRAIGVYKDKNDVRLVTVAYNQDTNEALVERQEKMDNNRDSSIRFKMLSDKLGFVR